MKPSERPVGQTRDWSDPEKIEDEYQQRDELRDWLTTINLGERLQKSQPPKPAPKRRS